MLTIRKKYIPCLMKSSSSGSKRSSSISGFVILAMFMHSCRLYTLSSLVESVYKDKDVIVACAF